MDFGSSGACPAGHVLGMRVDATSYRETAANIAALATTGEGGAVCVATVHMVMEAFDDPEFQRIVNAADRVTPDGVPLVWALIPPPTLPLFLSFSCLRSAQREVVPSTFQ